MESIFEAIFGSLLFEFIGAFTKWIYYYTKNKIIRKEAPSFKVIWSGRKGKYKNAQVFSGISNGLLGFLVLIILLLILVKILQ